MKPVTLLPNSKRGSMQAESQVWPPQSPRAKRGNAAAVHRALTPDLARMRAAWGDLDEVADESCGEVSDDDFLEASA
jgi:hypothetical protein